MKSIGDAVVFLLWRALPGRWRLRLSERLHAAHERGSITTPRSEVVVFSESEETKRYFPKAIVVRPELTFREPVSLIATCKNEVRTVRAWLESLAKQTRHPEEVVICDAGSTDGTREAIEQWYVDYTDCPFSLQLLIEPRCNIAAGRNKAIKRASHRVILCTDFGCRLDSTWAERILRPFATAKELEVSMGYYDIQVSTLWAKAFCHFLHGGLSHVQPELFLPSGRSLALTKNAWRAAGGFPEHLTLAGEDSLFDLNLKRSAERFAFVPDARVSWEMPGTFRALVRMVARYARGDAEGGEIGWRHYVWLLGQALRLGIELVFCLGLLVATIVWPNLFTAALFLASVLGVLLRLAYLVKRYRPSSGARDWAEWFRRVGAALGMAFGQSYGFSTGLLSRRKVEQRRVENQSTYTDHSSNSEEFNTPRIRRARP